MEVAMSIRIVRLGSERVEGEGLRIGIVNRPPRGVSKADFSSKNWYDVRFPNLAPSLETMKFGKSAKTEKDWMAFKRKYRAELAKPEKSHLLELLVALSHQTSFSVGCYCENEEHCHISVLRKLFIEKGADVKQEDQQIG